MQLNGRVRRYSISWTKWNLNPAILEQKLPRWGPIHRHYISGPWTVSIKINDIAKVGILELMEQNYSGLETCTSDRWTVPVKSCWM